MRTILLSGLVACGLASVAVAGSASEQIPAEEATERHPAWIDELISRYKAADVANPPASIIRYTYKEAPVYYVPPRCCDIPSRLHDVDGNILCAPDGGFTGRGDGRCADFRSAARDRTVIWQDTRQRKR